MKERHGDPEVTPLEPGLRELFDAARVDPVIGEAAVERVVARAAHLTGTPALGVQTGPGMLIAKGLGVVVVAAAVIGAWVSQESSRSTSALPHEALVESESRTLPEEEVSEASPMGMATELDAAVVVAPPPESSRPRRRPSRAVRSEQETQAVAVNDGDEAAPSEGVILLRARSALSRNAELCLSLTREHRSLYPSGLMREERDVLEVEALVQLGRAAEAQRRASAFEQTYPASPYLERIRRAVP